MRCFTNPLTMQITRCLHRKRKETLALKAARFWSLEPFSISCWCRVCNSKHSRYFGTTLVFGSDKLELVTVTNRSLSRWIFFGPMLFGQGTLFGSTKLRWMFKGYNVIKGYKRQGFLGHLNVNCMCFFSFFSVFQGLGC